MKKYNFLVIFNVPIPLGNGDSGFKVRAKNIREAKRIAKKKCLVAYKPKFVTLWNY